MFHFVCRDILTIQTLANLIAQEEEFLKFLKFDIFFFTISIKQLEEPPKNFANKKSDFLKTIFPFVYL